MRMERYYRISKGIHKYIGLLLVFFLVWMGISGIFLNHPEWIGKWRVPEWMTPSPYHLRNWNQGSLRHAVYLDKNNLVFSGLRGIWISKNLGASFSDFNQGLSANYLYRKTNDLFLDKKTGRLLAATEGGLFRRGREDKQWTRINLPVGSSDAIKRLLTTPRGLIIVTDSQVLIQEKPGTEVSTVKVERPNTGIELIQLFFKLHDGSFLGLPGKLVMDLTGLLLVFLSCSAIVIWVFPKMRQYPLSFLRYMKKVYRFCFKHHLQWSLWFFIPILLVGLTGMFMRPPLLVVLAGHQINPGILPANPWQKKIKNAVYLKDQNQLIIEADGWWSGELTTNIKMEPLTMDAPVHVMGTTILESPEEPKADLSGATQGEGNLLLGSFSGLIQRPLKGGPYIDAITGLPVKNRSRIRTHDYRITGYFRSPEGKRYIACHRKGLFEISNEKPVEVGSFRVPDEARAMPLWDFMFELHNGRLFSKWIGLASKLLVPLASILYVMLSLTGYFDWYMIKHYRKRKKPYEKRHLEAA